MGNLRIRHGDPVYAIDGLTEKGSREVALLAKKLSKERIDKIYSPPWAAQD
jgi:broad specificity phosphatase PhoE